ncbi:hypothetical protein VST7929_01301 [Vibrio stylophorae]|uniref:Nudix hydrolase domain-containing protein n=1 Tax=Vibrio stylophorae TaxID=659351 RepID=A0ABM8ZT09_9VIBR|nr:NUDIX hydrolase [Vibrio stylophorae]CAH0533433.1 hypothetical protein VST7929_01301 [Vibrio stylophorae]
MKLLRTTIHPDITDLETMRLVERPAARAIALDGQDILLMYTARYDDYSIPGGGLEPNESAQAGMIRELQEETGAQNIRDIMAFGCYEEYRPWYKDDANVMHMLSYCFTCRIDRELGDTQFEAYEIKNGMEPRWVNIHQAIAHNHRTMAESDKKGLSIERETFLLERIVDQLLG